MGGEVDETSKRNAVDGVSAGSVSDQTPPVKLGRRRSPATRKAILAAVLSTLRREPYAAISIERIAAKAKVSKHSIYRWWNSKGELVLDAFIDYALKHAVRIEGSADSFADLERFVLHALRSWEDPVFDKGWRGLVAEMSFDAELREKFNEIYLAPRKRHVAGIVMLGVERGQFRGDCDVEGVVEVVLGFMWLHILFDPPQMDEGETVQKLMKVLRPSLRIAP